MKGWDFILTFPLWGSLQGLKDRQQKREISISQIPISTFKPIVTGNFSAYRLSSHLDASPPPAEGLGTNVGGHKVAVAHPSRPAEEVGQAVGHAGGRVAGSLLCCNAASGEQTQG